MSKAGIQSNRGDGYQTLVAFDWALTVLSDSDYQWLEIDSVIWSVDDVVIGKADGTKICCQCKKNQSQHKAWSFSDLEDELRKAVNVLTNDPKTLVRFYSRSAFGDLAALKEFSSNYPDEATYRADLGKVNRETNSKLANLLSDQGSNLSTYDFLQRTKFEISPELDRMDILLQERLRNIVSNYSAAYSSLWTRLGQLSMREEGGSQNRVTQHRLTKSDLKFLLSHAGSLLSPPMDIREIRASFKSTSAIGRSWRKDIGNEHIANSAAKKLLEGIKAKYRSILLTGAPGSGKTCVMLAVQEKLEQVAQNCTDLLPLFIQSREFADINTEQDRQAQGLPAQWVERAARMAEDAHVVVMIDSLDVLSIAREHSVLTYFLAQIDRLLLVPNITVVTACREFDSKYDRRIAQRSWEEEIICEPLDWHSEIEPILVKIGIDASNTDSTTRELIRNPRELALFVELAQQQGSFNVVTSQALAQRYLETTIEANRFLGNTTMQAIESIASDMLKSRSLVVPHQRFIASEEVQRTLLSTGVLHKTQDGNLTFGHQTLLDVLVISGAIRQSVTLNEFIQNLPPVPFVRPSIRSFVEQLAVGERRKFRAQLRTVLTGNNAFHIRRLVAETFAEQVPQDDDWMLLRDLRNQHREVFQVIYNRARRVEWHHLWMKNLVPILKDTCNIEGLTAHAHRISLWKNEDPVGVSTYWTEMLSLELDNKIQLVNSMAHELAKIHADNRNIYVNLLLQLLNLPRHGRSFLGHSLALFLKSGLVDDTVLWSYITGEISEEDELSYRFNNKLHCQPYEFGGANDKFLAERMRNSTILLDLAIDSIEQWSQIKGTRHGYHWSFLRQTSYKDTHTQSDHRHRDSERFLMDSIEAAIKHHANSQTSWWRNNRERLCFNTEESLRYFSILAVTENPTSNIDVIGRMLCEKVLLKSDLSYELEELINKAYIFLPPSTQISIQENILTIDQENATDPQARSWMIKKQALLITAIPCHLRSTNSQAVLHECEKLVWPLIRQPYIYSRGGTVSAPFSSEVFLNISNNGVLCLLKHYNGYDRDSFTDFLVGGEREVGRQLREAASRQSSRFMAFLTDYWEQISERFRDDILEGVTTYLEHQYGSLQPRNNWSYIEKPDAEKLALNILENLEQHQDHWHHNQSASKAIENCAHIIKKTQDAARLVNLAMSFASLMEESTISGDSVDLLTYGINMRRGNIAEALIILANQLEASGVHWPDSLPAALRLYAGDKHPAIRAVMLRRMPYLQDRCPELGWELFDLALKESAEGLWAIAEPCLYNAYHQKFKIIAPRLAQLYREGYGKDYEAWGRISALAAFLKHIDFSTFIEELNAVETADAWRGAASVWTHHSNIQRYKEQCFVGLEAGLSAGNLHAIIIAHEFTSLFRESTSLFTVPIELFQRYFNLLESEIDSKRDDIFGIDTWLNAISVHEPMYALEIFEIYLDFVRRTKAYVHDYENSLTQLLTRLFAQAEELEESDSRAMLQRVVILQDTLLALGVIGVNDWLKAAERP
ncbi:ATPase family associated with various cellular activities (AAA) [Vibrio xiamenensis]|uniref:ATPase family associated with various cellular activities (AAA) n=1 Tax=Vibrio xiamenensis TaxID=861298 RepID=A0A1G8CG69_9VIBR|nr:AAA family ATPase [Vibrio xiamenensis]SDH43870.1 ATPase family associated with various cellular activities (AAA) [Vibrio xiamenensis]